jgi:glycosyltransferase involved in cell wall biosynthesis
VRILILIPAFNEAATLPALVTEIRSDAPAHEILIVDDGSDDETRALLPTLGVRWIRLPERRGPGAAVRVGLRYAQQRGFDAVVRLDGDGQHPARLLPALVEPLLDYRADVVIGSRFTHPRRSPSTPRARRAIQRCLGAVLTVLTQRPVTDPTSGLWAFGPHALAVLAEHHPSGYPEPELRLFLSRNRLRAVEIPVTMRERPAGQTSLTVRRTSAAMARLIIHLLVVPLRTAVRDRP